MNEPSSSLSAKRHWGIDVIAAIYGIATLLMVWLFFVGTGVGVAFAVIVGPVCAVLCYGMLFRVNGVRVVLMILLVIRSR